jgi:uncharacterized protein (TIGR00369 family)
VSGPTRSEIIRAFIPESPFAARLGLRLELLEPDRAVIVMPFEAGLATIGDVVHGGAISTLADTAAMAAAWASDEVPESVAGATVSLSVSFVAAAVGRDLRASARVRRRGGRMVFVDVDVEEDGGTLVAHALAVYRLG